MRVSTYIIMFQSTRTIHVLIEKRENDVYFRDIFSVTDSSSIFMLNCILLIVDFCCKCVNKNKQTKKYFF